MPNPEEPREWEKRFDEKFPIREVRYTNLPKGKRCEILVSGPEEIKQFIRSVESQARSITEKAFGSCKNCYGKGYHTTIEYAQSSEDFGGEGEYRWKLPEIRFCNCGRGKQLEKFFSGARKEERERIREIVMGLYNCNGPHDGSHKCSALHCDHCGRCDLIIELSDSLTTPEEDKGL